MGDHVSFELVRLNPILSPPFEFLVTESLRWHLFQPVKPPNTLVSIGAVINGYPIGIGLAVCNPLTRTAEILEIAIQKNYRNRHIGRQLLARLTQEAKNEGGRFFSFLYPEEDLSTPAIEKILAANGWDSSRLFMVRCLYDGYAFDPPWIHALSHFPTPYEEFPWQQLSFLEKNDIVQRLNDKAIPASISPFLDEAHLEPMNSLGLRHEEKVIGWMITHRQAPDTIRYSSLYIDPDHRKGFTIKLLIDAIHVQKKSQVKWALFEVPLLQVSSAWIYFIKRRLIPYANQITHLKQSTFYTS